MISTLAGDAKERIAENPNFAPMKLLKFACIMLFLWLFALASGAHADLFERLSPQESRAVETAYSSAESSPQTAAEALREALRDPASPEARFFLAELLRQAGRPGEALSELRMCLDTSPALPEAAMLAAHILLEFDRAESASDILAPLRRTPEAPLDAWMLSAYAWLAGDHLLEAETAARHVLARTNRPEMRRNARALLLHTLTRRNRDADAAALCAEMLKESPLDESLWQTRIQRLERAGDPEKTLAAIETARALHRADAASLLNGARILLQQNAPDHALGLLADALRRAPDRAASDASVDLIRWMGQTQAPGVIASLEEILGELPEQVRERASLKNAHLRLQAERAFHGENRDAALALYDELAARVPMDGFTRIRRGEIHERMGQAEEAALDYQRAATISGFEAEALLHLASLRAKAGHYAEAARIAERVLRFDNRESIRLYRDRLAELASQAP